ncbi:MAG: hypothetical protein Q7T55_04910 [Solirubrobacteraceae bacterium]|nr:hypothetical protein [Solirubrobacteraceae bacterium]
MAPAEVERDGRSWSTYVVFIEYEGGDDEATEYPAYRRAEKLLKRKDPKLFRKVEFDQEASGTGVYARSRADLRRALLLIGIPLEPRRTVLL